MTPEELERPSDFHEPEDLIAEARSRDSTLTPDDFSDATLAVYLGYSDYGPHETTDDVVRKILAHVADRRQKRTEGRPHRDDPVGLAERVGVERARADRLRQLMEQHEAERRAARGQTP